MAENTKNTTDNAKMPETWDELKEQPLFAGLPDMAKPQELNVAQSAEFSVTWQRISERNGKLGDMGLFGDDEADKPKKKPEVRRVRSRHPHGRDRAVRGHVLPRNRGRREAVGRVHPWPHLGEPVRAAGVPDHVLFGGTGKIKRLQDALGECRVAVSADFQRFYNINLPASMGRMEPSWLCDLLDGLEGVDGSLYRAWMAEHHPLLREDAKSMPRLSYLTYGQSQMLMLSMTTSLR